MKLSEFQAPEEQKPLFASFRLEGKKNPRLFRYWGPVRLISGSEVRIIREAWYERSYPRTDAGVQRKEVAYV